MTTPCPAEQDDRGTRLFECRGCGMRYAFSLPAADTSANCRRCGATLISISANSLQRALALALTGLVLVVIANTMPFMSMTIDGRLPAGEPDHRRRSRFSTTACGRSPCSSRFTTVVAARR